MKRFLIIVTAVAVVLFICGMAKADDRNGDRWFNRDQNNFRRFDPWRFDFDRDHLRRFDPWQLDFDRDDFRRFDPRRFDFDRDDFRRIDRFKNMPTVKELIHPTREVVSREQPCLSIWKLSSS